MFGAWSRNSVRESGADRRDAAALPSASATVRGGRRRGPGPRSLPAVVESGTAASGSRPGGGGRVGPDVPGLRLDLAGRARSARRFGGAGQLRDRDRSALAEGGRAVAATAEAGEASEPASSAGAGAVASLGRPESPTASPSPPTRDDQGASNAWARADGSGAAPEPGVRRAEPAATACGGKRIRGGLRSRSPSPRPHHPTTGVLRRTRRRTTTTHKEDISTVAYPPDILLWLDGRLSPSLDHRSFLRHLVPLRPFPFSLSPRHPPIGRCLRPRHVLSA